MASVLALLSKTFFEKHALIDKRLAVVGDVVPLTEYYASQARLKALDDGGSLFLVTVRPPYDRLVLVGELVSPAHADGRWKAAANRVPVTDISHLVGDLTFTDGKGLRASAVGKLGPALQTPKTLTDGDVHSLRTAVATASDPVPAVPLPGHEAAEVESLLEQCLKLAAADPFEAFTAARRAWQVTKWPRLAGVAERLAAVDDPGTARRLARLPNMTAVEVLKELESLASWEPDPRLARALITLVRSVPWTMFGADPTWNLACRILADLHDPRLLPLADGINRSSWLGERVDGLIHRLLRHPAPPSWPQADGLLSGIERVLDQSDEEFDDAAQPGAPPPPAVQAALPTALDVTVTHDFTSVEIIRLERRGTPPTLAIEIDKDKASRVLITDADGVPAASLPSGHWTLDPTGERLAIIGEQLTVYSTADGTRLASVPYPAPHHRSNTDPVWATADRIVIDTYHGLIRFDLDTGTATTLAGSLGRVGHVAIAVDPGTSTVLRWFHNTVHTFDLRDGRLLQAFEISVACRRESTAVSLGGGRFALGMFLLPSVLSRVEESAEIRITTVDAITGWSDTESQAAPLAERPLPSNADDLVRVFGEYWQWSNAKLDRWMFGDGTAATITKTGELGFLGQGGDKPVRRITVAAPTTPHLALSPDGRVTAATDGEAAMIWADRPRAARLAFSEIRHLTTSRSGLTALATGDRIMVVDSAGKRLATTKFRDLTRLAGCAAHDLIAAVNSRNIVVFDEDLGLRTTLSPPVRPAPAAETEGGKAAPAPKFTTVSWNRAGRKLVAGTNQGRVLVFDERTGESTLDIDVPGAVREVVFLPAHNALLVWTESGRLLLVDDTTGQIREQRDVPGMTGLAVHPAFGWVATGHDDGRVTLRDVGTPNIQAPDAQLDVGHHFGPVTALAFADDRLVVGAGRAGHRGSITTYQWTAPAGEAR